MSLGVPAGAIILSHVDKTQDLGYVRELAQSGVFVELDQSLRERAKGPDSITARAVAELVGAGLDDRIVLGTDGARRSLWASLGGEPGLAWLADGFPEVLRQIGIGEDVLAKLLHDNAARALTWRSAA